MEYFIICFEDKSDDDYVEVKELEKFLEDAEILISNLGIAWSKSFIKNIENSSRGAIIRFADGFTTYGYNIESKLVKAI